MGTYVGSDICFVLATRYSNIRPLSQCHAPISGLISLSSDLSHVTHRLVVEGGERYHDINVTFQHDVMSHDWTCWQ